MDKEVSITFDREQIELLLKAVRGLPFWDKPNVRLAVELRLTLARDVIMRPELTKEKP